MPRGTFHTVTGILLDSPRGLVLEVDGGGSGTWALDCGRKARSLLGRRVTVSGRRADFDLLDVERMHLA